MSRRFVVGILGLVAVADAAPSKKKELPPAPAAKLEDNCRDPECKKKALDHWTAELAKHKAGKATRPLRITMMGDSVFATDHIEKGLRDSFGKLIGNGGPGFAWAAEPHPFVQHFAVTVLTGSAWTVYGISTQGAADRLLGLGGSAEGGGTIRWLLQSPATSIDVHYLEQPKGGTFTLHAGKTQLSEVPTVGEKKKAKFHRVAVPADTKAIELRAKGGRVRLFGATLEADRGIVVDNLGIVSATAKGMQQYNLAEHMRNQLAHRGSDLVVVMYGTNEAEWYAPKSPAMADHEVVMGELLASIRAANTDASCLVVSVLDQLDWRQANLPPRASVPAMVETQKRAAAKHGCAFWNTYEWMGGKGSSGKWFKSGLLIQDFQHPTTAGNKRIADALFAGLNR